VIDIKLKPIFQLFGKTKIIAGLRLMLLIFCLMALAVMLGCATTPAASTTSVPDSTPQTPQPLQIVVVSVSSPVQPINPGGPVVEITLQNAGPEPIVSLTASLELGRSYIFNFDISSSQPLLTDKTISSKLTLIGGGFSDNLAYPLTINGTLQNGLALVYTTQVMIKPPIVNNPEISQAPIHDVKVSLMKSNPPQIGVYIQGGLRDGCTTFHDVAITREDSTINIIVTVQHPVEVACPAIYTYFEKNINLGSNFTFGTTYTLKVNSDFTTTFIYQ
jgi:hypothetical protein